jgi:hypothetical protein
MTFVPEALKPELLVRLLRLISDPLGAGSNVTLDAEVPS